MKYFAAFLSEVLVGALVGAALAIPIALVGRAIGAMKPGGFGDIVGALVGFGLAYPLGAGIGVIVIGRRVFHQIGLMWYTIIGAYVGAVIVGLLAEPTHLNQSTTALQITFAVVPPLVAAAIFTLSAWRIEKTLG